jgi:tRNA nucleotidyltransferase/poly(A) polymerase
MTRPRTAREAAHAIVDALRERGHIALLAGGCVRDMLLGLRPKDYDVATDARPDRVLEAFPNARKVGAKFGVILVRKYGCDIEVATFRTDGRYSDGRRPDAVTFGTAEEDARRRDFTINGLFLDPADNRVIDFVGGREDLERRLVRTIGDPYERFAEDHLRLLRAVRFAAGLGFTVDGPTLNAMKELGRCLSQISAERIWLELALILTHPARVAGWSVIRATGLCDHLVEGWQCASHTGDRIDARLRQLPPRPISPTLALAALWCDDAPNAVSQRAGALRLSNKDRAAVVWIVRTLPRLRDERALDLAELKTLMARRHWPDLLELLRADELAAGRDSSAHGRLVTRAMAIPADAVAPAPLLSGDDLREMGAQPGPHLGRILKTMYRAQLNEEITTLRDAAALARRLLHDEAAG